MEGQMQEEAGLKMGKMQFYLLMQEANGLNFSVLQLAGGY
jgi:hypothetical protein